MTPIIEELHRELDKLNADQQKMIDHKLLEMRLIAVEQCMWDMIDKQNKIEKMLKNFWLEM